ncbi:MAG: hypothetical protein K2Q09_04905, partial [Phycisphaerales bacterium]|nr:hypothetical protein [Phycisphaerales bacterium]
GGGAIATTPNILDKQTREKGERIAARAIQWLRSKQDAAKGAWGLPPQGPAFPAITGLAVNGVLMQPGIDANDPAVARAVVWLLTQQQPDGGIYDRLLPVYNTSIALSALARVDSDQARAAIKKGQDFLKRSQWGAADPIPGPDGPAKVVEADHPFYGGWGYGRHSRPDISNSIFALQALADTGVPSDDPAVRRALVFMQRLQMQEKGADGKVINEQPYARGSHQGGFIYAPSKDDKALGTGDSEAGTVEETLTTGETKSMMRAYGSVTYGGFKSYLYAGLKKDDPRVQAVLDFVRRNYTLAENPGIKANGMYYYYVMFSRALHASQQDVVDAGDAAGKVTPRNWRKDLIDQLATMQNEDGSFQSVDKRWMEDNQVLITAYALLAVQHALR